MLEHYPQVLSSQDHMNFMVKYAKKNDISMIKLGLKTASLCGHDYLNMLSFVITKNSPLLNIIATYKNNPHTEFPEELIDQIVSLLKGDINSINAYKKSLKLYNPKDRARLTALHVAVHNGHLAFAQLFLAQDQTLLNQIPCYDRAPLSNNENLLIMATPLEVAIRLKCLPLCEYLLSFKNVKLDTSTENYTLLEWTACYGTLETMKLVTNRLKQQYNQAHYNSLLSAKTLTFARDSQEKQLLLLHEMNYILPGKQQPLHIAACHNNIDLAMNMCNHSNTNINAQDENGNTPLFFAIKNNQKEFLNHLLNKGADPTILNGKLQTILHAATFNKNTCIMERLLNTKALKNINQQDIKGNTPLIYPTKKNYIDVVKLLLSYGADPDMKNLKNKTASDYTNSNEIKELLTKKIIL
jgi:ankyrin repeat protein